MTPQLVPATSDGELTFQRTLGDSELSYFLPSRDDGVNDMYLHLGFTAPTRLVNHDRLTLAWAILRCRHPLLASHVVMEEGRYTDARFIYTPPPSPDHALLDAQSNLKVVQSSKDALIDSYLNGPRTLSNTRLSYLILATPPSPSALPTPPATPDPSSFLDVDPTSDFDLLICACHFLGDGTALHTFANDLFTLLVSPGLTRKFDLEFQARQTHANSPPLPSSLESRLPQPCSTLQRVAHTLEFKASQARLIGGHSFPPAAPYSAPRHTVVPTISFDPEITTRILKRCKKEGVSIAHVIFALCSLAWAQTLDDDHELKKHPMMMYSALNLRPYLLPPPSSSPSPSYWFLAIGYFNVVLPTFLPAFPSSLWHRARLSKEQCIHATKAALFLPRARCMALERSARACAFAAADDRPKLDSKLPSPVHLPTPAPTPSPTFATTAARAKHPSAALVGLSLLGNLDGIYKHAEYPEVDMRCLTSGSRQRKGGILVFSYTFRGRLWMSLGWDEGEGQGERHRRVTEWWGSFVKGVEALGA